MVATQKYFNGILDILGKYHCYSIETVRNRKDLIGIGIDRDELAAASKCLSEFFERYILECFIEPKIRDHIYGTAFHPNELLAIKMSLEEFFERATVAVAIFSKNSAVKLIQPPGGDKILHDLDCRWSRHIYEMEYFSNHPVYYVELSEGENVANGFALSNDLALEKAILEAFRRMKVFLLTSKPQSSVSEKQKKIELKKGLIYPKPDQLSLLQIKNIKYEIMGLGVFSLHYSESLPAALNTDFDPKYLGSLLCHTQKGNKPWTSSKLN